jgi:iron complex outermembrane receptor protein
MNLMPVMRPKGGKVKRKRVHSPVRCRFKPQETMFKTIIAAMAMLWSAGTAFGQQYSLYGTVQNAATMQPLAGATLEVKELKRFSVSDESGKYSIDRLPSGTYTIEVRYVGFREILRTVSISETKQLDFDLDESTQITDEVVVYSTRAGSKTPTTYSAISKLMLQKQNFGQDLPFLINWTPSVVTTSDAGNGVGYTGIRIRGSDATRVNVTINGIPYNDSESLGTFWVDVPDIASSSQSIQIQRGVGTSTNGAGAFGASINLQTNTRNDKPYAELATSGGSFGTFRNTFGFGTGLIDERWVIDGRVSKIISDGFIDRASSDLQSYYFSAGLYNNGTMLKGIAFGGKERTYQSWYGVPQSRLENDTEAMLITAANEGWNEEQTENLLNSDSRTFNPYTYKDQVDDYRQNHYQLHLSQRVGDALTANLSAHYTKGKGYYEEYRYDDDLSAYGLPPITIGDSLIESTDIIRRRWLDNDFYGFTYSFNYNVDSWEVVLGGAWNRYDGDHYGEIIWAEVSTVPAGYRYYFNNGDKKDFNTYLKTTYQFSTALSAYVDVQLRRVDYVAVGIESKQNALDVDMDFLFFNPKAGLTFMASPNQQLYLSYSVANREPVRDDFVDAAPGRIPKHETLYNLEAGYRRTGDIISLNANYYLMDYKNQLVLTGQVNDVGASIRTNVDKSYRMGLELEAIARISQNLSLNANLTLSRNKIKNFDEVLYDYGTGFDEFNEVKRSYSDTDISFSPNVIVGSSLMYKPFKNAELALLTKHVGRQFLDNTSNDARSIAGYYINDLRFNYTFKPAFLREIAFSVLVNNIFDKKYESNGYTWGYIGGGAEYRENYFFPQAGTNFLVMLTVKI